MGEEKVWQLTHLGVGKVTGYVRKKLGSRYP